MLNSSLDSLGILSSLKQFPLQCKQVIREISQQPLPPQCSLVDNIVVSGMGGSALGGRIIGSLERQTLKIPLVVSTEYHLPRFVNAKTLVVVSSYSGNTEETISSLAEARARGAQVFIIASGGKLEQLADEHHLPAYIFHPGHNPSGQPRMGLGYAVVALAALLSRCQIIEPIARLGELPEFLTQKQADFDSLLPLAKFLVDGIPVLVTSEHLKGAAHAVKNMFNENSKNFSVTFDLPELNHHLMEGLAFPKAAHQYLKFVFITSPKYHPDVKKRYPITQDVVSKQHYQYLTHELDAPSRFFEVMQFLQEGAYLSYCLALLNGIDPGPIPWVDYFKDEVGKR